MIKLLGTAVAVLVTVGLAAPALAAQITIPAGTQVQVRLVNPISSGTAVSGQHFPFQVAAPVVIGDRIVIPKGSSGTGRVINVSKAQGKSPGSMTLEFSQVHAADGSLVTLSQVPHPKSGNAEKGKASTATIAATVALGPLGLFAHNMVKGKDITVTPKQTFPAWVKQSSVVAVR